MKERIGVIDIRGALRYKVNPLIRACLAEQRKIVFVYPFEEDIGNYMIRGINSNKLELIYNCLSNFHSEIKKLGGQLIILYPPNYNKFFQYLSEIELDVKVFYGRSYPGKINLFLDKCVKKGIESKGISTTFTTIDIVKTFSSSPLSKFLNSFDDFIDRELIIPRFTYPTPIEFFHLNIKSNTKVLTRYPGLNIDLDWFNNGIQSYGQDNLSRLEVSSKLGKYLKYGVLSRQEMFIKSRSPDSSENLEGNLFFGNSLLKRDYIYAKACIYPTSFNRKYSLKKGDISIWSQWLKGDSDSKLFNSAMKELRLSGFIPYPLRFLVIKTALSMGVPTELIRETFNYLLLDDDEVITTYYLNNMEECIFNFPLMAYMEKTYISKYQGENISVEPIRFKCIKFKLN